MNKITRNIIAYFVVELIRPIGALVNTKLYVSQGRTGSLGYPGFKIQTRKSHDIFFFVI